MTTQLTQPQTQIEVIAQLAIAAQNLAQAAAATASTSHVDRAKQIPKGFPIAELYNQIRQRFQQLENAQAVLEKHKRSKAENLIPSSLKHSISMAFPNYYKLVATRTGHALDEDADADNFDLDSRLSQIVQKQQRELADYVLLHLEASAKLATDRVSTSSMSNLIDNLLCEYTTGLAKLLTEQEIVRTRNELKPQLVCIAEDYRRECQVKMSSRIDKAATKAQKRKAELQKAEEKFALLPATALVGLAVANGIQKSESQKGNDKKLHVHGNPTLADLVDQRVHPSEAPVIEADLHRGAQVIEAALHKGAPVIEAAQGARVKEKEKAKAKAKAKMHAGRIAGATAEDAHHQGGMEKARAKAKEKNKCASNEPQSRTASTDHVGAVTGQEKSPRLVPVHNLTGKDLPPAVSLFLAKGHKFVPDLHAMTWSTLAKAGNSLKRTVDIQEFFGPTPYTTKRLKTKSHWTPPSSQKGRILHSIYNECLNSWSFGEHINNFTYWDRYALRWLKRRQTEFIIADSDKNLGTAICPRDWVQQSSENHLADQCVE
eukprot:6492045-Amphidinium_carterae.1